MNPEQMRPNVSERFAYFSALYQHHPDFDLDLYREAVRELEEERARAKSPTAHIRLDHERFLDAYHPKTPISALETRTLIPPYPFRQAELSTFAHAPRTLFSTTDKPVGELIGGYSVRTYGIERIHRILSGVLFCAPSDEADIVGTSQLDCCQALAGRRKDGTLLLAHIPGPGFFALRHGFDGFLRTLEPDDLVLIHPHIPEDGYLREEDAARAIEANTWFKMFAESRSLPAVSFISSSIPGARIHSSSYQETAVTVSRYGISIGTHIVQPNPKQRGTSLYVHGAIREIRW